MMNFSLLIIEGNSVTAFLWVGLGTETFLFESADGNASKIFC